MAALGNIGKTFKLSKAQMACWFVFGLDKNPTSVDMTPVAGQFSSVPFSFAVLTRNGVFQQRVRSDGSGQWHFYNMDDSGSQIYSIATYTQDGATGEAWTATVVGSVATVTKTFASQRAVAAAFT